jgi:hypothetical protein
MFAAGLSPSELGLKASLKESLSFGGRVDVKSRSHNAADASHIEDSPTTARHSSLDLYLLFFFFHASCIHIPTVFFSSVPLSSPPQRPDSVYPC